MSKLMRVLTLVPRSLGQGVVYGIRSAGSGNLWLQGHGYVTGESSFHNLLRRFNGSNWVNHDYDGRGFGLFDIFPVGTDSTHYFENSWDYLFDGTGWADVFKAGATDSGTGGQFAGTGASDFLLFVDGGVAGGFNPSTIYWYRYNGAWTLNSQVVAPVAYPYHYYYITGASRSAAGGYWLTLTIYSPTSGDQLYGVAHLDTGGTMAVVLTSIPGGFTYDYRYQGVSAVSETEVYILRYSNHGGFVDGLILYNSGSVTDLDFHTVNPNFRATTVSALNSGQIWIGGDNGLLEATVMHYDGTPGSWTQTVLPHHFSSAYSTSNVYSVLVRSSSDIWAGGHESDLLGNPNPMTWHYDGTSWTAIPVYPSH